MEKLRILHVIETLAIEGGGGDRAYAELAEAQMQNGHEVTVLCIQSEDRPTPLSIPDLPVIRVPSTRGGGVGRLLRKLGWNPAFREQLSTLLEDVDVVHCHSAWRLLQVYVRRTCRAKGIPYVSQPHGSFMPNHLLHRLWYKRVWGAVFERRNLSAAAALLAETKSDLADIEAYYPHPRIPIVPCGTKQVSGNLDQAAFAARFPEVSDHPYILYLGRLDFQKGVDTLILAFEHMSAERPDLRLAIVGPDDNNMRAKLEQLVSDRGLETVHFLSTVTDALEKKALFSRATCFVLPSHSENFGITVLEALSVKCPVLVSRATGWADLEQEGGGLVFTPSHDGVTDALHRFFSLSTDQRTAMIERGHAIAAAYEWRDIARKLDVVYREILTERGSRQ